MICLVKEKERGSKRRGIIICFLVLLQPQQGGVPNNGYKQQAKTTATIFQQGMDDSIHSFFPLHKVLCLQNRSKDKSFHQCSVVQIYYYVIMRY